LVRDASAADEVRAWHAAVTPGPLLLLPLDSKLHSGGLKQPSNERVDEGEHEELSGLVKVESVATQWVRALLGQVRAIERGTAFVDARGAVWLPANFAGPGPLRRRAELATSRRQLKSAQHSRGKAAEAADRARAVLETAERTAAVAQETAAIASRETGEYEDLFTGVNRRHNRAVRELAEASALLDRISARDDALTDTIARADSAADELSASIAAYDAELADARALLAETEFKQDEARDRRTASQVACAQSQARLQVAADRERHLHEELTTAASRLESLHSELSTLSVADGQLAEQLAGWQMDLEARQATLEDAEARLASAEHAVRTADERLESAEHSLTASRHGATAMSDELHSAELRYAELSGRHAAIRERLEAEWRRPLESLMKGAQQLDLDDEALRAEAHQLRDQLDALGPVNPLAIEEHEEEQRRLEFLTAQRADLASARLSLQQAIREIDETARDLFAATFVHVRENFRKIFTTLFGGGECDLRLENPESPLDGDIEVHAAPRGKRTQRIHLLSSGERALVALSLLFGIFLTKPSPFCLLDEVDAPLDDANIGRFVRMLNEFKAKTQFIVITHNPRTTTEAADAVYGVTMQEPGVSSLVSVHMRGAALDDAIAGTLKASPPVTALSA
jgi:chromosome segregation protein